MYCYRVMHHRLSLNGIYLFETSKTETEKQGTGL